MQVAELRPRRIGSRLLKNVLIHRTTRWLGSTLSWIEASWSDKAGCGGGWRCAAGRRRRSVVLDGRELVNFGSNDYLGLAADERLAAAARAAIEREGWGSGASPLVSGASRASHAELERRLAEFEGTEAALVFPSGFAANAGIDSGAGGRARRDLRRCQESRQPHRRLPAVAGHAVRLSALRLRRARSACSATPAAFAAG